MAPSVPQIPIELFVSPMGSDSNPGSQASPFRTIERAYAQALSNNLRYHIRPAAGSYPLSAQVLYSSRPGSASATAPVIVGARDNLLGDRTSTAASSTVLTDGTMTGVRSGNSISTAAGAPAGQVRITGLSGLTSADVGKQFLFAGGASAGNNGTFQLATVNSSSSGDFINAQAVVGDANNGLVGFTWQDSFIGLRLFIKSGAAAGQSRLISSNTTTAFTLNTPLNPVPVAGAVFSVERSNVEITYSGANGTEFSEGQIGFVDVRFRCTSTGKNLIFRTIQTNLEGCEFDLNGGTLLITNGSALVSGNEPDANFQWGNDDQNPFSPLANGSGAFIHNGTLVCTAVSRMAGFFCMTSVAMTLGLGSNASLSSLWANRLTMTLQQGASATHTGAVGFPSAWNGQLTTSATSGLLNVRSNASVDTWTGMDMFGSGGDAIFVLGGKAYVGAVTSTGTPANAGVGVHVDGFGYAKIDQNSATTTVTGTLGDTKFGHPATADIETYATVRTLVPAVTGQAGYADAYGNRIEP